MPASPSGTTPSRTASFWTTPPPCAVRSRPPRPPGCPALCWWPGKAQLEPGGPHPQNSRRDRLAHRRAPHQGAGAENQRPHRAARRTCPGTFAWKEPDARPQAGGSFAVVFTPADARRYTAVEQQVQLTVKEQPVPTAAPALTRPPLPRPTPAPSASPAPSATPAASAAPEGPASDADEPASAGGRAARLSPAPAGAGRGRGDRRRGAGGARAPPVLNPER